MSRVDNLPSPVPLKSHFTHPSPSVVSAYSICRLPSLVVDPIQHHRPPNDETVRAKLIHIRILGHLLSQSHFLSDTAISEVARAIISCRKGLTGTHETDVEELNKLGEFYMNYLLRPFRRFKGPAGTPDISTPPSDSDVSASLSEESFQLTEDEVAQMLTETPKSYATWRKLAKHREDHRCIVTGILDLPFAEGLHTLTGEVYRGGVAYLKFCRIFAESTYMDIGREEDEDEDDYRRNVWDVLKSFGYTDIVNHLATPDNTHLLENVMMMTSNLRYHFDRLSMWLEPIENVPNRYRICSIWDLYEVTVGQEVTFHSTDPRSPLPNREFLRIHAACCRVAHLAGASYLFRKLEEDMESDSDSGMGAPEIARALHAHLEHLSGCN